MSRVTHMLRRLHLASLSEVSSTNAVLLVIVVVSVLLRVGVALAMGNQVTALPGIADQISYNTLALRVLGGYGFSFGQPWWPATAANQPTAHWSFLYTSYLVLVYGLIGHFPLAARLIQAIVVGVLQPLLVYWIARRLFGQSVGLIAGAVMAVYAYFVYYSAAIMTESFFIICLALVILVAFRLGRIDERGQHSVWMASPARLGLLLGVSAGALVLLRQAALIILPVIWLWIVVAGRRQGQLRDAVIGTAISAVVVAAMILPWTVYNYQRFHQFVLLNTNAGFAFYLSNHPIYGTVFQPILSEDVATYRSLIPTSLIHLNEAQLDHALLQLGIGFVVTDPVRYVLLSLSRIPVFFMFWPSPDSSTFSNLARSLSFGLMWPFMLAGIVMVARKQGVRRFLEGESGLLFVVIVVYTGVHLLSWALIRYRIPLDALLLPFAGVSLQATWMWLQRHRGGMNGRRDQGLPGRASTEKRGG